METGNTDFDKTYSRAYFVSNAATRTFRKAEVSYFALEIDDAAFCKAYAIHAEAMDVFDLAVEAWRRRVERQEFQCLVKELRFHLQPNRETANDRVLDPL